MQPSQPQLRSTRLLLSPLVAADTEAVATIFRVPETSRYLGIDFSHRPNLDAMMTRRLAYVGTTGTGHWLVRDNNGRTVGLAHLRDSWELPDAPPELGWYLDPDHSGRGFATEAVSALIDYGTHALGLASVWALAHDDIAPSHAVARRAGLLPVGRGIHYGAPHTVYRTAGAQDDATA